MAIAKPTKKGSAKAKATRAKSRNARKPATATTARAKGAKAKPAKAKPAKAKPAKAKPAKATSQESFGAYLDRVLPLLGPEIKTAHFEWNVTICHGERHIPNGFIFPFEQLDPDLGEWERKLETEGFYPEDVDPRGGTFGEWDELAFVLLNPGPDPEAAMTELITTTIDESAALRAWVRSGRRFLWRLHDMPVSEYRFTIAS